MGSTKVGSRHLDVRANEGLVGSRTAASRLLEAGSPCQLCWQHSLLFFGVINEMMDILSSLILNPSGPPNSSALANLFSGLLLTEGLGPFSFTFLTLTPLGALGPFGESFLPSSSELSFEIFRTGLFHGLFFSLPFSIPMLICFRRYILDGVSLGHYAFAGTLLGHLSFLFCTLHGIRPIIHFWYPFEPLLSLLGLALSLKVATDFFSQRRFVFDGTLGSSEDSSAYALNPWPQMPEISWLFPEEVAKKIPPSLLALMRIPKTLFVGLFGLFRAVFLSKVFEPIRIPFQKFQNFCQKNLGPSIFTFQFFLMWLNPASASTLNLLFFEHDLLQGVFLAPHAPIFLLYTFGFLFSAAALSTFILFLISQLAGRNFGGLFATSPQRAGLSSVAAFGKPQLGANEVGSRHSSWFQRASRMIQFDEALAQNRFKIFNKFFAFLIIGCVIQGGLNYTWRLFLQYPLEMIHWDFFTTLTKKFPLFQESMNEQSRPAPSGISQESTLNAPHELFEKIPFPQRQQKSVTGEPISLAALNAKISSLMEEIYKATVVEMNAPGPESSVSGARQSDKLTDELNGLRAKKRAYLQHHKGENSALDSVTLPVSRPDEMKLASSFFLSPSSQGGKGKNRVVGETYWSHVTENKDFLDSTRSSVRAAHTRGAMEPGANEGGSGLLADSTNSGEAGINFFGRREFPPYDTSIRNREKNLPVERHLAIERVNARRGLMGRPPLENEERENAIFKYHTFFMNQIDRAVEDVKMKLVTPPDLYREENDILALQKLHENFLKQKGRESEYQNSVQQLTKGATPTRGAKALPANSKANTVSRHPRDFFTKSRPITNTTKGFSKSSYIRDLFDPNLNEAYSAYSHDDLLLEKIISNTPLLKK